MITNEQYKYSPIQGGYRGHDRGDIISGHSARYVRSPRRRRANARSLGWMVTRLSWMAARFVSSKSETRYASDASWSAITAEDWKRRSVCARASGQTRVRMQVVRGKQTDLEVLRDLADEPLEGQLADEELRRLLVPTDLAERDGTRPEAVRLLHTTGRSLNVDGVEGASPNAR